MNDAIKNILNQDDIEYLYKNNGYTFLNKLIALSKKNPMLYDIIEEYCKQNPGEINKVNSFGVTTLVEASKYKNNITVVKILCNNGADVNYCKNSKYWSALIQASRKNCMEILKILCDNGANINYTSKCSWTALNFAISNLNINAVKFLCDRGANVNTCFSFLESEPIAAILLEYDSALLFKNVKAYQNILNKIKLLNNKN